MKVSRIFSALVALALAAAASSFAKAAPLDAPHTFHRRNSESHLSLAHRSHRATAHASPHAAAPSKSASAHTASKATGARAASAARRAVLIPHGAATGRARRASFTTHRHRYYERFTASSFASGDIFGADVTTGEDPVIRQAAIDALGDMNGTAVVINPSNGRILALVNQKLALSPGAEPCSTIKITVAMAALSEGLVTRDTMVRLPGFRMNMTQALAKSNNLYFEELGRELGFERVRHYANQFGLGELAGYNIPGEQLGVYPDEALPASQGGVGRMCSFGESVQVTPLQLGALVSAIANGGTLYYLQHPQTPDEIASFTPKVKRILDIAPLLPDMHVGMAAAVQYGTARSLRANFREFPVMGKTGTCSNNGVRYGWFGSFADTPTGRIVTVIFLEGGRPTFGPKAAELTGQFYRALYDRAYFTPKSQPIADATTGTR